jgi:hypothetical protein
MRLRAQAKIMALFAPRREVAEPTTRDWRHDWYWSGAHAFPGGAHPPVRKCVMYLHRKLHALKSMTDHEYKSMRGSRCVSNGELDDFNRNGRIISARAQEVWKVRAEIRGTWERLPATVQSLPQAWGYAADQDEFGLRSNFKERWWINARFSSYVPLEKRLALHKEMSRVRRCHEERRIAEREAEARAEQYECLVRKIRELESQLAGCGPLEKAAAQ